MQALRFSKTSYWLKINFKTANKLTQLKISNSFRLCVVVAKILKYLNLNRLHLKNS